MPEVVVCLAGIDLGPPGPLRGNSDSGPLGTRDILGLQSLLWNHPEESQLDPMVLVLCQAHFSLISALVMCLLP